MVPFIKLNILGVPSQKDRPRFSKATGHAYTPTTMAEWKGAARFEIKTKLGEDWTRLDERCMTFVTAVFDRPNRLICKHKTKCDCDDSKRVPMESSPDRDNMVGIVMDSLQDAGAYKNDSRDYQGGERKFYGGINEIPHCEIVLVWGADLDRVLWPPDFLEDTW